MTRWSLFATKKAGHRVSPAARSSPPQGLPRDLVKEARSFYARRHEAWADGTLLNQSLRGGPVRDDVKALAAETIDAALAVELVKQCDEKSDSYGALWIGAAAGGPLSPAWDSSTLKTIILNARRVGSYDIAHEYLVAYRSAFGAEMWVSALAGQNAFDRGAFADAFEAYVAAFDEWAQLPRLRPMLVTQAAQSIISLPWSDEQKDAAFRRLLKVVGPLTEAAGEYFEFLYDAKLPDRAVSFYEENCDGLDLGPREYMRVVQAYLSVGNDKQAMPLVETVLGKYPQNHWFRGLRVLLEFRSANLERARDALYEQIGQIEEGAILSRIFGREADLVPYFSDGVAKIVAQSSAAASDAEGDSATYVALAELLLQPIGKLRSLEKGVTRETPELRPYGAASHKDMLTAFRATASAARLLLLRAVTLDERNADAYASLSKVMSVLGNEEAATALQEQACLQSVNDKTIAADFARMLIDAGRFDDAIKVVGGLDRRHTNHTAAEAVAFRDWGSGSETLVEAKLEASEPITATAFLDGKALPFSVRLDEANISIRRESNVMLLDEAYPIDGAGRLLLVEPVIITTDDSYVRISSKRGGVFRKPNSPQRMSGRCLYLGGCPAHYDSYFHAIAQNFVKIPYLVDEFGLAEETILLHSRTPSWAVELLKVMGVSEDRLVMLTPDVPLLFDDLVLADPPLLAEVPNRILVKKFRDWILGDRPPASRRRNRRIFFSRLKGDYRPRLLINEEQLTGIAASYGFEILDPGRLSIPEQIEMMREASVVCGATGAALTNTLYGDPSLRVVCMSPSETCRNYYPSLAAAVGQTFVWCLGRFVPEGLHSRMFPHLPYYVDPENFAVAIEHVLRDIDA